MGFDPNTARYSYRVLSVVAATAWTDGLKPRAAQVSRRRRLYRAGVLGAIIERGSTCATRHWRDANLSRISEPRATTGCRATTPSAQRSNVPISSMAAPPTCVPRCAKRCTVFAARQVGPVVLAPVQPQQDCWAQRCAGSSRSIGGRAAVVREAHERALRALVRLPRERAESRWKSSGLPCASFWILRGPPPNALIIAPALQNNA